MKEHQKNKSLLDTSNIHKESGFEVPKGYFDHVEDQFSINLAEESIPDTSGFSTPDDYFDQLEDCILAKVAPEKKVKVISLQNKLYKWSSVAAILLVTLSAILYYTIPREEFNSEEAFAWIDNNLESFSENDIAYQFDEAIEFEEVELFPSSDGNIQIENFLDENDTYILIENSNISLDQIN